ncbi:hypothetical protein BO94DRAFT_619657 [Aspergillus sclerotioniger CBS 115572]|uniref:CinA C-terminal domain-containing protein n=1 Tax=Aspergillus sclerotioniger CBS 115572 TaxID=1450535 RepID=A0A317XGR4_9EURO|nr:hypothetical protein BO94DRAFT_619657 [Aspergillus sclerotioniger CBS 115572]PWY96548.1 hypothetical protein BO94DRAFT_619657 [Aspergillus sclerotioniger CBS 115572]
MDIFTPHPPHRTFTIEETATTIIQTLKQANQTLGVAESLTGGGLMAAITSISGSSAVFHGGVVSYATPLKQEILGVDEQLIAKEGVIHAEVARQMAKGARRITSHGDNKTTWGVGTTGVAGPTPQDDKPAGTVYIGVASERRVWAWGPFNFSGGREEVRRATVREALCLLKDVVEGRVSEDMIVSEVEGRG